MIAIEAIQDAARLILDPSYTRIALDSWVAILNRVQRKMCSRMDILEAEAYFNIVADADRYAYPTDATQITELRYSDTPDDDTSYTFIDEGVREEWRAAVDGNYPTGVPQKYLARSQWFYVWPRPDTSITNGGLIAFYHLPFNIVTPESEELEIPDLAFDHLVEGMIIEGQRALNMYAEARDRYMDWIQILEPEVKNRLEDRSQDRRPSMRPRGYRGNASHV